MNNILDIWERANIANGRGILLALGFDEDDINLAQLSKVLEDEVRVGLEEETHLTLVRALVALQCAELSTLRVSCRQLHDENAKLRNDNKDANRRVAMLALEIDERHASLEDAAQKEIRSLEQRHASVVRELTTRLSNDREHWTQLTASLEERIKSFEQEEIKLRTELELLRKGNDDMEAQQPKLQRQVAELLEQNKQLLRQVAELELQVSDKPKSQAENGSVNKSGQEQPQEEEILHMVKQLATLQLENTELRDKYDELLVELENLNLELQRAKSKQKKQAEVEVSLALEEAGESGAAATATKRRGDSPSKTRLTEESPRLGKLRKRATETDAGETASDTSGEWVALNSELKHSQNNSETAAVESGAAEERCRELEASLEQMQRAYEDCEDYWQGKLSEERQLFEKERLIYEEEQQESDRKFTELMEKVREYEEQFSKDGRLSPIEEKDILEQQYVELEAETEELRARARKLHEEKALEIEALQQEIADLRMRLGESVEILTGASELHCEAKAAAAAAAAGQAPSSASSPISYLWQQSTIQEPAKNFEHFQNKQSAETLSMLR